MKPFFFQNTGGAVAGIKYRIPRQGKEPLQTGRQGPAVPVVRTRAGELRFLANSLHNKELARSFFWYF
jgi:hypothetical protein